MTYCLAYQQALDISMLLVGMRAESPAGHQAVLQARALCGGRPAEEARLRRRVRLHDVALPVHPGAKFSLSSLCLQCHCTTAGLQAAGVFVFV